jgi:hypothetical protein
MRRLKLWLVIVAAVALVTASAAAAVTWHKRSKTHTDPVTTTLTASQTEIKNKTCTGEDGAYRQFRGKWTGTANTTGDPRLRGALRLHASGLINEGTSNGQVTGWLSIRGEKSAAKARFWAVHRTGGQLSGFVVGWVRDKTGGTAEEQTGSGRLLGTLTGTLMANGAFTGQIGAGAQVAAANIQGGGCSHRNRTRSR